MTREQSRMAIKSWLTACTRDKLDVNYVADRILNLTHPQEECKCQCHCTEPLHGYQDLECGRELKNCAHCTPQAVQAVQGEWGKEGDIEGRIQELESLLAEVKHRYEDEMDEDYELFEYNEALDEVMFVINKRIEELKK